jgi:biotin carboxylase
VTRSHDGAILIINYEPNLIEMCGRLNLPTVLVHGPYLHDRGMPALPDCVTPVLAENQHDAESILSAIHRNGFSNLRPAGVHTTSEWAVTIASVLGELYGCGRTDPHAMIGFRDKSVQKTRLRAAGIPVADFEVIEDLHHLPADFATSIEHGVLKPIAGGGSTHTSTVHGAEGIVDASHRVRAQNSPSRTFIHESYNAGEEWLCDGYVFDGELKFWSLAGYQHPVLNTIENAGLHINRRFDPNADAELFSIAEPLVANSLKALNFTNGLFHMEMFFDRGTGRIVFGECAARRGGALIREEILYKFQVDLIAAGLLCAIGQDPEQQVRIRPDTVGSVLFPAQPGILLDRPTAAELRQVPGVEFARMEMSIGSQHGIRNNIDYQGAAMITASSPDEYDKRVGEVCDWYAERAIVLPQGLNKQEFMQWQRTTWPDRDFDDSIYRPMQ